MEYLITNVLMAEPDKHKPSEFIPTWKKHWSVWRVDWHSKCIDEHVKMLHEKSNQLNMFCAERKCLEQKLFKSSSKNNGCIVCLAGTQNLVE